MSLSSASNEHLLVAEMECICQLITIFQLIVAMIYLSVKKLLSNTTRTQTRSVTAERVTDCICSSCFPDVPHFFRQGAEAQKV